MGPTAALNIYESKICAPGKMILLMGTIVVGVQDIDDPITIDSFDFDGVAVCPADLAALKKICTANTVLH